MEGDEIAVFPSTSNPTIFDDKTARRKGQDLDDFALVGSSIELVDLGVAVATDVVYVAFRGEADLRSQLPVSKGVVNSVKSFARCSRLHNALNTKSDTVMFARLLQDEGVGRMITVIMQAAVSGNVR